MKHFQLADKTLIWAITRANIAKMWRKDIKNIITIVVDNQSTFDYHAKID